MFAVQFIPEGDWFCPECKPRQRTRRPNRKRPSMDSDEEEEELLDDDVQEQSESGEDEETAMSEEERLATQMNCFYRMYFRSCCSYQPDIDFTVKLLC